MSNSTYFLQECPTCGRRLQVRVEYLGKHVVCQHCQGHFRASEPSHAPSGAAQHENALLRRADELLETVERRKLPSRSPHPR
jgi:hypothetical protein